MKRKKPNYNKIVNDFVDGHKTDMYSTIGCVTRTLFLPIILIIFLAFITEHKITTPAFVKELFTRDYLLALCFILLGVFQSLTGTILILLGKVITKYYPLVTLYPSKIGLRYEVNKYWDLISWLSVLWLPILVPAGLIINFYPFSGPNTLIAVSMIFALFFMSGIYWDEIWREKLYPCQNPKVYLTLVKDSNIS